MVRSIWLWGIITFVLLLGGETSPGAEIPFPKRPIDTTTIEKMRLGNSPVPPASAKGRELIAELARWLTHRLVHPPFNNVEPKTRIPGPPEDLETLMAETERWMRRPDPNAKPTEQQLDYGKILGEEMEIQLMFVMGETVNKLEKVNAARMLALIGKLPCEGLADSYLKIMRDDKKFPPEIQLFAFEGMANLLSIPDTGDPNKNFIGKNAKQAEIATELDRHITKKYPPGISAEQAHVIQFIRRAAVRALAQMKPSVIRRGLDILAKPIWTLLRVATNDKYVKPADVALPGYGYQPLERIEAIIGICSMVPDRKMDLEVVVYLLNDALLDLMTFHQTESSQYQKDPRNKPLVPWRIMANRLNEALKLWKDNTKTLPANRNPSVVVEWADQVSSKCLNKLESLGVEAQPDAVPLRNWKNRKPKNSKVIEDDDATEVALK